MTQKEPHNYNYTAKATQMQRTKIAIQSYSKSEYHDKNTIITYIIVYYNRKQLFGWPTSNTGRSVCRGSRMISSTSLLGCRWCVVDVTGAVTCANSRSRRNTCDPVTHGWWRATHLFLGAVQLLLKNVAWAAVLVLHGRKLHLERNFIPDYPADYRCNFR